MTDWDSMGRVATQTIDRAFDFLLWLEKLGRVFEMCGRVFEKLSLAFERLGRVFKASIRPSVSLKKVHENLVCN